MSKTDNSESENFLTRWSSRKLASRGQPARQEAEHEPRAENGAVESGEVEHSAVEHSALAEPRRNVDTRESAPFDPAQLPPLDSIGAETNVADFLRKEVPADLTRAALRRAWTSDPAIKNFVGLVENGWDFNDPAAMSGFGPISAEEVARLAGKVIEALPEGAPKQETKEILSADKKSQLASDDASAAAPDQDTCKSAEPGRSAGHDAAQQSEPDEKS